MEEVKQSVCQILSLNDVDMKKVLDRLHALGVTCLDDLCMVKEDDLTEGGILLPIPARKLVKFWLANGNANDHENYQLMEHLSPSNSTSAVASTSLVPVAASSSTFPSFVLVENAHNVNWTKNFDISTCVALMKQSESIATAQAARDLCSGQPLKPAARNELVRFIMNTVFQMCKSPSRASLNLVAEMTVLKYRQLEDRIQGTVIGPGYLSLRNQLECRAAYVKRPANAVCRTSAVRRRLSVTDDNLPEPKRKLRDGYGCIDFIPIDLPDGENLETLNQKQQSLKLMYTVSKNSWNETEISNLMACTYYIQRQDLVGHLPLTVFEIEEEWPFLLEPRWMFQHLKRLLGVAIPEKLEQSLMEKKTSLMKYLLTKSLMKKDLARRIAETDLSTDTPVVLIQLLMALFEENEGTLFCSSEVLPDKVSPDAAAQSNIPETPCIVFQGTSFHTAQAFRIVVDRRLCIPVYTPLSAFAVLFGSFFLFNISYPSDAGATLEYVQRALLGINPSTGSKIARGAGKKTRSGVHEAVLGLVKNMAVDELCA